jgi:gas vesicle protein GvpL/GvpF
MTTDNARTSGTWVYGVVPAGASLDELDRRRDDLPEVWVVEAGDLGAVVGPLPEQGEKGTRDRALAHAQVLEAAAADAPVVPFRFGTIADGGDEVVASEVLERRHDELADLLDNLEGKVQLNLKVSYDEKAVLREILASEPEIMRLREAIRAKGDEASQDERVRLGELVSTGVDQRRARDSADIVELLEPAALATVVGAIEDEYMVLNAAFLVARDRQAEFESAVEAVADERRRRMRFRLLGPMPAYDFIDTGAPA